MREHLFPPGASCVGISGSSRGSCLSDMKPCSKQISCRICQQASYVTGPVSTQVAVQGMQPRVSLLWLWDLGSIKVGREPAAWINLESSSRSGWVKPTTLWVSSSVVVVDQVQTALQNEPGIVQ